MENFIEANNPWYIQNEDLTINIAINTMDCIRIFIKFKELKEKEKSNDADNIEKQNN